MSLSNLFRFRKTSRSSDSFGKNLAVRRSRFEPLERRELLALAVTTADYQALSAANSLSGTDDAVVWVSSLDDSTNVNDGKITFREAIDYAGQKLTSGETVASTIKFAIGGSITLSSASQSLKILNKSVSIDASEVGGVTIQGRNSLLLYVFGGTANAPTSVSLKSLTFNGGKTTATSAKGAGVQLGQYCNLTATQCSFTNNATAGLGGAIYVGSGSASLIDSVVSGNSATSLGGAIYVESGTFAASRTTFSSNSSATGGAVYLKGGSATLDGCLFSTNEATGGNGGAIYSTDSTIVLDNASFLSNKSSEDGGAVYLNGEKDSAFTDVKFVDNEGANGGAIYLDARSLTTSNAKFVRNSATRSGGALFVCANAGAKIENGSFQANASTLNGGAIRNEGSFYLTNGEFDSNVANGNGGAVSSAYYVEIRDATFANNTAAQNGGAVHNQNDTTSWLLRTKIIDSSAYEGAGIYNDGGLGVVDSDLENNAASSNGGAIANLGTLFVTKSTFVGNIANGLNGAGGALLNYPNSTSTVNNSIFSDNSVPNGSGGAIANGANGVLVVSATAVDSNAAGEFGGGLYNAGTLTVQYSTISNNKGNNGGGIANTYGSSANFVGSTLWRNVAETNGGAIYTYGSAAFQSSVVSWNVASTAQVAAYYYAADATSAPTFDSNSTVSNNIAASAVERKNPNEKVVVFDSETRELVNDQFFFGDLALQDNSIRKTFVIKNVGSNVQRFSTFSQIGGADSSTVFSCSLTTSNGSELDLSAPFELAPNESVLLSVVADPKKIGSKIIELSWTTNEINAEGTAIPNTRKTVSLTGTAEVAKSGAVNSSVSSLPNSDCNISYNDDGSLSISLGKVPSSRAFVYLKSSENATLWTETDGEITETDVLLFTSDNYNVPQTVRVSLNDDYLRENGSFGSAVLIYPQLLSTDSGWSGSTFPTVALGIESFATFVGESSFDLNRLSSGTTRWDVNGDGVADLVSYNSPAWVGSSEVVGDAITAYKTRNGVTTSTEFDVAKLAALPSARGEIETFSNVPGAVRLSIASEGCVAKRWRVDWGDGTPLTEINAFSDAQVLSHFYDKDGEYSISVEIVDGDGIGANVWSRAGIVKITGVAQTSGAELDAFENLDAFYSELADSEEVESANDSSTNASAVLAGPQFGQKKDKRPLSIF